VTDIPSSEQSCWTNCLPAVNMLCGPVIGLVAAAGLLVPKRSWIRSTFDVYCHWRTNGQSRTTYSVRRVVVFFNPFNLLTTTATEQPQLSRYVSADYWTATFTTRSPAVARIADRAGCQWPSESSKVNNFHLLWKNVCHFQFVINSNLGRDMTSFILNFLPPLP